MASKTHAGPYRHKASGRWRVIDKTTKKTRYFGTRALAVEFLRDPSVEPSGVAPPPVRIEASDVPTTRADWLAALGRAVADALADDTMDPLARVRAIASAATAALPYLRDQDESDKLAELETAMDEMMAAARSGAAGARRTEPITAN